MVVNCATEWTAALRRAVARGIRVRHVETVVDGYDEMRRFEASSASRPGLIHRVALVATGDGISVVCECEGGQQGRQCQHAAAVLRYADLIPPLVELESTPAAEDSARGAQVLARLRAQAAEAEDAWDSRHWDDRHVRQIA